MDRAKDVAANRHLDLVLTKAEKQAKPEKRKKVPKVPKPAKAERDFFRALLNSDNPLEREMARSILGG